MELKISNGSIVIKPELRQEWAEAAKIMNAADDNDFVLPDLFDKFENEEWTW